MINHQTPIETVCVERLQRAGLCFCDFGHVSDTFVIFIRKCCLPPEQNYQAVYIEACVIAETVYKAALCGNVTAECCLNLHAQSVSFIQSFCCVLYPDQKDLSISSAETCCSVCLTSLCHLMSFVTPEEFCYGGTAWSPWVTLQNSCSVIYEGTKWELLWSAIC